MPTHRYVLGGIFIVLVALTLSGCARSGATGEKKMLDYLGTKYEESFEAVDVSGDSFLPPQYTPAHGVVIVHPTSDQSELFMVGEDPDAPGELKDDRVLAAWSNWYERQYADGVREAFGEGATLKVQTGTPESWQLGRAQLKQSPETLFQDPKRESILSFLVAVPTTGSVDVAQQYDAIMRVWGNVKDANSGQGYPGLYVYFYTPGEDVNRFMEFQSIPGVTLDWRALPGIQGFLGFDIETAPSNLEELSALYEPFGESQ